MTRIALAQTRPLAAPDTRANLARARDLATRAKGAGADLLVLPELYATGYAIGRDTLHALAEPPGGALARGYDALARETGLALLYGYPERDGDRVFNSARLVDADGAERVVYRKAQLFGPEEKACFAAGDHLPTVDWAGRRLGLLICYDIEFPEAVRALARAGADTILVPTANMTPFTLVPTILVRARAIENGISVAYANHVGPEGDLVFTGLSAIFGPCGEVLAAAGETAEALLVADLPGLAETAERLDLSTQLADLRAGLGAGPARR